MSEFDIAAALIVMAAVFGLLNHHFLKLPPAIGLLIMALAAALAVMGVDALWPAAGIGETVRAAVRSIDFHETVMEVMLGFLLFAGALHVDLSELAEQKWVVAILASVGVMVSTALVGFGFHWIAGVPLAVALVFGALISPTDPVAVIGILKTAGAPKSLETKIAGESLFNDGVGVVVFLILAAIAFPAAGAGEIGAAEIAELFLVEAVGGAVLGGGAGWLAFQATRRVDEYQLEVLLTLALVMGSYSLAHAIHVSGPIAAVVAGLFIGNRGMEEGMSEVTREHVTKFWELIDEILNAVLFLLIGVEILVVDWQAGQFQVGLLAIPLVLASRFVAVALPISVLRLKRAFTPGAATILTWGGLRGGISVALVLSLPESEIKPLLITATYSVVLFSIIVQGLTVRRVVAALARERA